MLNRYFICFLSPTAFAVLLLGIVLWISAGRTVQSSYWETEGLRRKLELASVPQPKLLIVAGSNAYFGLRAEQFEARLQRRSINLGMQAGLSFDFIAELIKPILRAGDIVVLPLEYTYYGNVHDQILDRTNTLVASVAWSLFPEFVLTYPPLEQLNFIRHLTFYRLWEALVSYQRPPKDISGYRVVGLNEWGDNTIDYRTPSTPGFLISNLEDERRRGLPSFDATSARAQQLRSFVFWAKTKDISVIATFPNTLDALPFSGVEFSTLQADVRRFWTELEVPFVDGAGSETIGPAAMLDTPYHPTIDGAVTRTAVLLDRLCGFAVACTLKGVAQ